MKLGQPYQITFENGITIVCTFLGDKDNVQDAVKILESNSEGFDSHIQRIKDEREKFIAEHEMNSITGQKVNNLNSQLDAVTSFKQAKEKYGTLKPLDELMNDEKVLMEVFS
jgi:proline dehydrogenase